MLPYATYADYKRMMKITTDTANGERLITDYLKRVTNYINGMTRRRFYPFQETHMYNVPTRYTDLRNRVYIYDDLPLAKDLLETVSLQTRSTDIQNSNATVTGNITAIQTDIVVSDITQLDTLGVCAFVVNGFIQIEDEILRIVTLNTGANTITCERGVLQTNAVAHVDGTPIYRIPTNQLVQGQDYYLLEMNSSPYYAYRLKFPNSWYGTYALQNWQFKSPQVYVTGFWGYQRLYSEAWVNTLETVPVAGITSTATTFTLSDVDGTDDIGETRIEVGMLLRIDNELMWVTAVNTTSNLVTVLRGRHGTMPLAHTSGTRILRYQVERDIQEACLSCAKTWKQSDDSIGGRQGVTDMSAGVEISMPKDVVEILKRYVKTIRSI